MLLFHPALLAFVDFRPCIPHCTHNTHGSYSCSAHRLATALHAARSAPRPCRQDSAEGPSSSTSGCDCDTVSVSVPPEELGTGMEAWGDGARRQGRALEAWQAAAVRPYRCTPLTAQAALHAHGGQAAYSGSGVCCGSGVLWVGAGLSEVPTCVAAAALIPGMLSWMSAWLSCSLGVGGSEGGGLSGTQVVPPVPDTEVPAGHTTHRCSRSPLDQAVASSVRLGTGVRHAQDVDD